MAEKTIKVRGSGGAVFDVVVTPRVLKKLKTGVLVRLDVAKPKRGEQKPKTEAPPEPGAEGSTLSDSGPETDPPADVGDGAAEGSGGAG